MQNLPWKKIAIGVVAIGIIAFGVLYFTESRGKKASTNFINPAFSEYITSYTAGVSPCGERALWWRDAPRETGLFDQTPRIASSSRESEKFPRQS